MILVSPPSWDYVQFQEAGNGQFDCSELGGQRISGESECRIAAMKLGEWFGDIKLSENYPSGCYLFGNTYVNWNKHHVGAADDQSSPICKVGGKNNIKLILKYFIAL